MANLTLCRAHLRPAPASWGERDGQRVELLNGGLLSFGGFGDPKAEDREQRQTWWLASGADKWVRRADMGRGRAFFGSARIGDAVFLIGESVGSYDFARDKWSELVPAGKLPRSHFGVAAIGQELFVLGGYGGSEAALLVVDTDKRSVRSAPPPPEFAAGDHFHLVVALRGELHVVGGMHVDKPRARLLMRFTPMSATWQSLTPKSKRLLARREQQRRPTGRVKATFGSSRVAAAPGLAMPVHATLGGRRTRWRLPSQLHRASTPELTIAAPVPDGRGTRHAPQPVSCSRARSPGATSTVRRELAAAAQDALVTARR